MGLAAIGVRSLWGEKLRGRSWRRLEIGEDRKEAAAEVEIGRDGASGCRLGDKRGWTIVEISNLGMGPQTPRSLYTLRRYNQRSLGSIGFRDSWK